MTPSIDLLLFWVVVTKGPLACVCACSSALENAAGRGDRLGCGGQREWMCVVVRVCVDVSIWQLFICVGRWTNTRCQIRLEIQVTLDKTEREDRQLIISLFRY